MPNSVPPSFDGFALVGSLAIVAQFSFRSMTLRRRVFLLLNLSERFPFGFFSSGSRCGPPPFGASLSGCLSGHPFGFLSDILPVHLFPGFPYGPPSRASFSGCPPGPSSRTAPADLPVGRAFHSPRPVTPGSVLHRLSALRSEPPCFRRLSALPVRAGLLLCLCLAGSASLPSLDFSEDSSLARPPESSVALLAAARFRRHGVLSEFASRSESYTRCGTAFIGSVVPVCRWPFPRLSGFPTTSRADYVKQPVHPLFEFRVPPESCPTSPSQPAAANRLLSWAFVPFST
jgi:hypothetical protein